MPKYRSKITILVFFLTTIGSLLLTMNSLAQTRPASPMINISPTILNIVLSPGKTYTYEIKLKNLLTSPLPIKTSFERIETVDEDKTPVPSILDWLSLDKTDTIIPENSSESFYLQVKLPNRIPIGGYYGILYFQPLFPHVENYSSLIGARIGIPIMASIGVANPFAADAQITKFDFSQPWFNDSHITFDFSVRNSSLSHFSAKPFLTVKPLLGQTHTYPLLEKIILPGHSRSWTNDMKLNEGLGLYQGVLSVSVGNGRQIEKTNLLIILPIGRLTFIILLCGLIVYLYRKRHRLRTVVRILLKG